MGSHKASVHSGKIPQVDIVQKAMKSLSELGLEESRRDLGTKAGSGAADRDGSEETALRMGHKVRSAGDSGLTDVTAERNHYTPVYSSGRASPTQPPKPQ